MHESFFSACMCVYTSWLSRFGSQVFRRGYLASIGYGQKKASRVCMNGNNNNNNRYQNNILQQVAGLQTNINSYLLMVRYYVFKFLL